MKNAGERGRTLADGPSCEVAEWLPHELSPVDAAHEATVVKTWHGPDSRRRALAEASALACVDHAHLASLRGLVDDGRRLGILLPRLSTITARRWLAARGALPAGEAVTLLIPLLRALVHLERRGLDRLVDLASGVTLDDVLFDARGAPIVASLRAAAASGPERLWRTAGGAAAAGRRLVADVTQHLSPGVDRDGLADALSAEPPPELDELVEVVFALAEPTPLTRVAVALDTGGEGDGHALEPPSQGPELRRRLDAVGRRILDSLRTIRPRVWVTCGIVVASCVGALSLLAGSGRDPAPPSAGPASTAGTAPTPGTAPTSRTGETSGTAPTSGPGETARATDPVSGDKAVLAGDDADAAFRLLLRLRAACLHELDTDCLAGVDEAGSPASDADRAAVDDPSRLGTVAVGLVAGDVVNRLGGAVLYDARTTPDDEPASVLMTKTEAGWRLRSISVDAP
ncbi:hypothetical protein [Frondihabitans australicus]|uniref:Uncharacterized protein n=1 Tax=Frondihabitans australicus TaxID=386892 RepID=A0A495IEV2_9MICO|nr:hypothetical protein [Frondihabitans australicus]RKR74018.1 hypothetical protein C8E83_1120 [Frondihabitans australicus]